MDRGVGTFTIIIIVFLIIMTLPLFLSEFIPVFRYLLAGYLALVIWVFVRNMLGPGMVSNIMSGILVYIFIVQFWALFVSAYMLFLIAGFMLSGIIIFGLQKHG